jgi:NAD(P)-dependent dehydrogenase (short-subunit alcohol dehydrogenase family)
MNTSANYGSLAGKRVFVTGGGSGIGVTIVEAFAIQGALNRYQSRLQP